MYLVGRVDRSVPRQQQRHYVHVPFLRREVQRRDPLARHRVGGGAVLQQRGGYLHLILLGCDVERRVAVLGGEETESRARWLVLTRSLTRGCAIICAAVISVKTPQCNAAVTTKAR